MFLSFPPVARGSPRRSELAARTPADAGRERLRLRSLVALVLLPAPVGHLQILFVHQHQKDCLSTEEPLGTRPMQCHAAQRAGVFGRTCSSSFFSAGDTSSSSSSPPRMNFGRITC